tara:strand:- start:369 stop:614 length:246 start_codon:yes stop_codon:yes gene_type:complete
LSSTISVEKIGLFSGFSARKEGNCHKTFIEGRQRPVLCGTRPIRAFSGDCLARIAAGRRAAPLQNGLRPAIKKAGGLAGIS